MKSTLSLKGQLTAIILGVTLFSTFLAFSFSIIYDYRNSHDNLKSIMQFNAHSMAENCKSPLLFSDTLGARDLLLSFRSIPMVLYAALLDSNNSVFAFYAKDGKEMVETYKYSNQEAGYFDKTGLHISNTIVQENLFFARFVMHVSTDDIKRKFQINLMVFLSVFLIIIIVSYFVTMRLQRIISKPILELKDLAEYITVHTDYSIRIPHTRQNEIGLLQSSFDLMVQQLNRNILSLKNEIADRIHSQMETQHLRTYLQNIMDSISSLIIAVDTHGSIKQVNQATACFFENEPESFLNLFVTEAIPMLKGKEDIVNSCISSNKAETFPVTYYHQNSSRTLNFNVKIFPLVKTAIEGVVLVIDDITEKNRLEMMMIQSEKMASLGGLAAGTAHEINNPLGIISQGVQNILRHIDPEVLRNQEIASELKIDLFNVKAYLEARKIFRYLEGIRDASKRASDIVANMLQFSRMSNQSKTLANIKDVISHTIELAGNDYELKKKFDFRQIKINTDYDESRVELFCNVTEIQQVILNLLKNAAHALYDKKSDGFVPEITIRTRFSNGQLRIEIEDNGPGIPDSIQNRVFEPFFTTKEVGVGTGLGLSVSFFIITKNHSGTIELESKTGEGTKFIIQLPLLHNLNK